MKRPTGSITVAALLGTGLATIGFALSGVSALGDDLRVAAKDAQPTTPLLTPSEENAEGTTPEGGSEADLRELLRDRQSTLTLKQACLERKARDARRRAQGAKAAGPAPAPSTPTLAAPASGREL